MAELNVSPGPQVGRILETIREAQAAGDVSTRDDALDLARSMLGGGSAPSSARSGGA